MKSSMFKTITIICLLATVSGCALPKPPATSENIAKASELVDRGVLFLRANKFDEAQASFEAASEIGQIPAALDGLGCIAFLRGEPEVAIKLFEAAYNQGGYPMALANLALVQESLGNLTVADTLYRRAIAEDPKNYKARGNFSVFMAEYLDEREEARRELLKAKVIESTPLLIHNQRVMDEVLLDW